MAGARRSATPSLRLRARASRPSRGATLAMPASPPLGRASRQRSPRPQSGPGRDKLGLGCLPAYCYLSSLYLTIEAAEFVLDHSRFDRGPVPPDEAGLPVDQRRGRGPLGPAFVPPPPGPFSPLLRPGVRLPSRTGVLSPGASLKLVSKHYSVLVHCLSVSLVRSVRLYTVSLGVSLLSRAGLCRSVCLRHPGGAAAAPFALSLPDPSPCARGPTPRRAPLDLAPLLLPRPRTRDAPVLQSP